MVNKNNVVMIDYKVKIDGSDEVIDSSEGKKPLAFLVGKEQVIAKLDEDVVGKDIGYSVNLVISPEGAYGDYDESAIENLSREHFAGIELEKEQTLFGATEDGQQVQVTVKDFTDEIVVVDYNHPLAGKTLNFSYTIKGVRESTKEELEGAFLPENAQESCSTDGSKESKGGCCSTDGNKSGCGCK